MEGTSDNGGTWTALGSAASLTANGDIFKVGTGGISAKLDGGATGAQGGMQITRGTAFDFDDAGTRRGMVAVWVNTTSVIGSGGIRLIAGTDASNNHEWIMATPDGSTGITYEGGWVRCVVDLSVTPDVTNGTMTSTEWAAMDYFAIEFDIVTDIMGNIQTIYIDQMDVLTAADIANGTRAIEVIGTTATSGNAIDELSALSTVTDLGAIVKTASGAYNLNMPIKFGDDGTGNSTITSKNEYVFIPPHRFGAGFCAIEFDGGTGTNTATWGEESGTGDNTLGALGGSFVCGEVGNGQIIASQTDTSVTLAGVVIDGMNTMTWTQTNAKIVSCLIVNTGAITLDSGAEIRDSTISDSTAASGTGAIIFGAAPTDPEFRDMIIQNCIHALEWETNGANTLDLRNIKFSNNTADLRFNHTTGLLTVNVLEKGDTPSTSDGGGGGTISVINAVEVKVTILGADDGLAIQDVRVGVETNVGKTEIINALTNASGIVINSGYNYGGTPTLVDIRCNKGEEKYQKLQGTVNENGLDVTVLLAPQPQYTQT